MNALVQSSFLRESLALTAALSLICFKMPAVHRLDSENVALSDTHHEE